MSFRYSAVFLACMPQEVYLCFLDQSLNMCDIAESDDKNRDARLSEQALVSLPRKEENTCCSILRVFVVGISAAAWETWWLLTAGFPATPLF